MYNVCSHNMPGKIKYFLIRQKLFFNYLFFVEMHDVVDSSRCRYYVCGSTADRVDILTGSQLRFDFVIVECLSGY